MAEIESAAGTRERRGRRVGRERMESSGRTEIRGARSEDIRGISALLAEYAPLGLVRERSQEELRRQLGSFTVAVAPGGLIGCVALRIHTPVLAESASLAVDQACQK